MEDRPQTPRSEGFGQNKKNQDPLLHKKYFSKYRTIKKLGEGSFGKVYKQNIMENIMQLNLKIKQKDKIY